MLDFFKHLFDTSGFPARWYCGTWTPPHGWLHVISDLAIFGAYLAIPCVLGYFVYRRKDVPFPKIFWFFGVFILTCGLMHLVEAIIFWKPVYRVSGAIKAVTAVSSWATVAALVPVMPKALALPSLAKINDELAQEVAERKKAQDQVGYANTKLEKKNKELEAFVYTASHDLKAPLVTFSGYLNLLKDEIESGSYDNAPEFVNSLGATDIHPHVVIPAASQTKAAKLEAFFS